MKKTVLLSGLLAGALLTGCGYTRSVMESPVLTSTGAAVVTDDGSPALRKTTVTGYALFQADNTAKVKTANGEWNKDRQSLNSDTAASSDMGSVAMKGLTDIASMALQAYLNRPATAATVPGSTTVQGTVIPPTLAWVNGQLVITGGPFDKITQQKDGSYAICAGPLCWISIPPPKP